MMSKAVEQLSFDNQMLKRLPVDDPSAEKYLVQRQVRGAHWSRVAPTPVQNPQLVAASHAALVSAPPLACPASAVT